MNEYKRTTLKTVLAVIVGLTIVLFALLIGMVFKFSLINNIVMSWILTTLFAIFGFFLIDSRVNINPIQYVEKPVIKEVFIDRPVDRIVQVPVNNRVVEVVEKPVIKEVFIDRPVDRIIYRTIEKQRKKLNIPHFNFIGSIKTRTYHRRTCKFSKMLKNKYKLHSNSMAFFKKKHYKACKTCIKNKNSKKSKK